ncbi:Receptor family ligand binding region containing protein, putative [Angomonas deanei]|uniref:Receptor family ligand binding region containing protein, putative n=1 Tax=Angomonas deanei TaxID=59799 RepID=A0A7G2CF77_9TRYP|nr:Receptor family ligand binding region containing protein, putative [Angomonas deanei]
MKLFHWFAVLLAVTVLVLVQGDDITPLKWAVLVDLSRSEIEEASFLEGVTKYIQENTDFAAADGPKYFSNRPNIQDSKGDLLTALTQISALISNPDTIPDVLFLGESADITFSVSDLLRVMNLIDKVLIVSIHSSNNLICDPENNPRTVCIVPRDNLNVRGLLETVSSQLGWHSLAMIFSNSGYGTNVQSAVARQVQEASTTPTIVMQDYMNPKGTEEEDDALVKKIIASKTMGVACFLRESQVQRLRNALVRANAGGIYIIGSREALNILPSLKGNSTATEKPWGALYVSMYNVEKNFVSLGYFTQGKIDPFESYIISHLFDAMRMVALSGGTSNITKLRSVNFDGYTGKVAFDSIYYQRVGMKFSVITYDYTVDNSLASWYLVNYSTQAVQTRSDVVSLMIPSSPLRSLPICMTAPPLCGDVEKMWAMLLVLQAYNDKNANDNTTISFLPVVINTGTSGVTGLSSLIPVARTCSIITGPGHANIAVALTPVVNEFKITTLDYNTANDFFTTEQYSYPYFSRSTTPNSFSFLAYGEICVHYSWERVVIVSTNDQFGLTRAANLESSMRRRNIFVEKVYYMNDTKKESIKATMAAIYQVCVSRVVFMLLAVGDDEAADFFSLPDELSYMKQYIFILNRDLCAYGYGHPNARQKLVSSICIYPHVPQDRLESINALLKADTERTKQMRLTLSDGGFLTQVERCSLSDIHAQSGFAVDAAYVIIDAVERAKTANASLNVSANLLPYVRSTSIDKFTGAFTIESNGNRNFAIFAVDIQTPQDVVTIGTWNSKAVPTLVITVDNFLWLTGSKAVPADTFRDMSFVLGSTVGASPGAIVISVLGFLVTIAVFIFCYRHYKVQKLMEHALQSNEFPVTDEELARLRGKAEDL